MLRFFSSLCVCILLFAATAGTVQAQSDDTGDGNIQSNNPLAHLRVLGFENYYYRKLNDVPKHDTSNSFLLRFAFPSEILGTRWVTRATLPINTFPIGGFKSGQPNYKQKTGIGDLNIISAYLFDLNDPGVSFGLGPQITLPTATKKYLGTQKLSIGATNVLFNARNPLFQWGYLLTWQASVAGKDKREGVSTGLFQPFWYLQLGKGWYARSSGIMSYDFKTDDYAIPAGLGLGRVVPINKKVQVNIFVEPQYYVARKGVGQPRWGVFSGVDFNW